MQGFQKLGSLFPHVDGGCTLTRNNDARVLGLSFHVLVSRIGDCEHMGRSFVDLPALVFLHISSVVDGQLSVRVHRDQHFADVRVDATFAESGKRMPEVSNAVGQLAQVYISKYVRGLRTQLEKVLYPRKTMILYPRK